MAKLPEINFPNTDDIASNVRIFEGIAPPNANTDLSFAKNALVGIFSTPTPSNGPDYGLTQGGSLTGTAIIDLFEKTSPSNEGIMRLSNFGEDDTVWDSLTSDGSLTGWSIRTIVSDYFGPVYATTPISGILSSFYVNYFNTPNARILVGPTGNENSYMMYKVLFVISPRPDTDIVYFFEIDDISQALPNPLTGDAYAVGTPPQLYIWNGNEWNIYNNFEFGNQLPSSGTNGDIFLLTVPNSSELYFWQESEWEFLGTFAIYNPFSGSLTLTGSTASIDDVFAQNNSTETEFQTFQCIGPGSGTEEPATFTGPIPGTESSYFTSTTPLTGGAECEYPYIWNWGPKWQQWRYDCTEEVWLARGASITQGGNGPQGFRGFIGLKGPTAQGEVGATGPQGFQGFQGTIGRQGFQGVQGSQGFQGVQGFQGFQGFQGTIGRQGFQGRIGLNAPSGDDRQIQYKSGSAFAADSRATVGVDNSLDLNTGYSGNFLNYSESVRVDSTAYSNGGTITLSFGSYNTYRATNISLNADATLTIQGFDSAKTGQTLTLVLGHTGPSTSKIAFKGTDNIHWQDGPFGNDDGGQTAFLYPETTKIYDVFYFINDGQRTYGNRSNNYRSNP